MPQLKKVKRLLRNGFKGRSAAFVMNCSKTTIRRAIKDSGLKSYVKTEVQLPTYMHIKKRIEFARYWRKSFNSKYSRQIMFSDEKQFNLNGYENKKNDVVYRLGGLVFVLR